MTFRILLSAAVASTISLANPIEAIASEDGCVFSGARLDCSDGRKKNKWSQITQAFASEQTRKLLSEPLDELDRFEKPIHREHFRVSIEHTWEAVNQFDRYSRDLLKRKEITNSEYQERVAVREDALKSYRSAYWFYKNLNWQSDQ